MGYIGCYILYITLFAIGSILLMDITLYDVYIKIKLLIKGIIGDEKINNQNKKNNKKSEKRVNNDTIEVVVQDNNEKEDFIKGINNKIQILDFMKNSELKDINPLQDFKIDGDFSNEDNQKEESFNIKVPDTEKINKKLSYEDKEVVTKEIEDSLNDQMK